MRKPTTAALTAAQGSAKEENPDQVDVIMSSTFNCDPNLLQTQVEIEIPQSCRDILDTSICSVVITGPQDIGFLPDLDFEQPLEPFPATENLIQDFLMDWGPAAIMTEEDLPPMDTIDDHLLQTAGETGETVTAASREFIDGIFTGSRSGQPRSPADFGTPRHLLTEEVSSQHPNPESKLSSTVDGSSFHVERAHVTVESLQEHLPQPFDITDGGLGAPTTEEEIWGHVQQFTYQDPDYSLEDMYGLRGSEDTNLMLYPTPALGSAITTSGHSGVFMPNEDGSHFEGTGSSNIAMSEEAFIPTVVNERLETIQQVEEEENPSIQAMQPSTSNIVLARRSESLPNLASPFTYEASGQPPLGQLRNFSLVDATVGNNGSRVRRGRPPRFLIVGTTSITVLMQCHFQMFHTTQSRAVHHT